MGTEMKGGKETENECGNREEAKRFGYGWVTTRFATPKRFVRTLNSSAAKNISEFVAYLWNFSNHHGCHKTAKSAY